MYHCIKELVQQYSDTERSLYMAYVFDNNIPLYLQVIDIIKKKIVAGVYQPGQQLEPVRALAAGSTPAIGSSKIYRSACLDITKTN